MLYMHIKRQQIDQILGRIKDDDKISNNIISKDKLQKAILDYHVRKHDDKISALHKQFKAVDDNEDGIIDTYQL